MEVFNHVKLSLSPVTASHVNAHAKLVVFKTTKVHQFAPLSLVFALIRSRSRGRAAVERHASRQFSFDGKDFQVPAADRQKHPGQPMNLTY
jgi:hypothetical protein